MAFDHEKLQDILVCPKSKTALVRDENSLICVDPDCRLRYEIRDEIPIMLLDEAQELKKDQWSQIMQKHGRDPQTGEAAQTSQTPSRSGSSSSGDASEESTSS